MALGVDHQTVATIADAVAVLADAVDADDRTLIFDGPCSQQCTPVGAALCGPVGDVDQCVKVVVVAAPDREA